VCAAMLHTQNAKFPEFSDGSLGFWYMSDHPRLRNFIYIILALAGTFNIGYALYTLINISELGLIDFSIYWYAGVFIRQGINPYLGFLQNLRISFPISLVNGIIASAGTIIAHPRMLRGLPMNTAPFILFITPFSFLSLKMATIIWTILNIILAVFIPITIVRYFQQKDLVLPKYIYLISVLTFFSLSTTSRGVIAMGQNSLLIFFLMLLALLAADKRKFVLAGILLGLALSKYTVAIPMLVLFLFRKNWRVLFVAVAVQIFGFVLLSLLTRSSPVSSLLYYLSILNSHLTESNRNLGINIGDYLPVGVLFPVLSLIFTTIPVGALIYYVKKKATINKTENPLMEANLFSILLLWILLAVNNLGYDAILTIFPFLLFAVIMENSQAVGLNKKTVNLLFILTSFVFILLNMPGSVLRFVFSIPRVASIAITISVVFLLLINIWMLYITSIRTKTG
jgi:hypothetical protein